MENYKNKYTCNEYRDEMLLLALNKRLNEHDLSEDEKQRIIKEIKKLESVMGMD